MSRLIIFIYVNGCVYLKASVEYCFLSKYFIDIAFAGLDTMATKMKLKLKTVFVLYFMVSLLGLVYALMQLGKLALHRSETDKHTSEESHLMYHFCRTTLWLYRAWPAQRSDHILAAGGTEPSSGADEEVWGDQTAPETSSQVLLTHHLCHHPDICKVAVIVCLLQALIPPLASLCIWWHKTLYFFTVQAGAEGRTDSIVPDVPPRSPAALDRGGGFSTQDATGDWLPYEEWPDLHPPARAHRQGPQTAGGAGDGCKRHICFSLLVSAVLTFLCSLSSAGWPQLAEAPWGRAEERGPAVVEGGQKAPAWRRQAARGGLLRRRRQHVQPAVIWRGGICINSYLSSPEQVFVLLKNSMLPCHRWGAPSECRCGLWGWLEGWNTRDLWWREERSVLVPHERNDFRESFIVDLSNQRVFYIITCAQ